MTDYFSHLNDPRVEGRCLHLLSDILIVAVCTYLTGGCDYQDMHMFAKERGKQLEGLVQLANGAPCADTFERVFKRLDADALRESLTLHGREQLSSLAEKQIILDGKKLRGVIALQVEAIEACTYSMLG